jgi:hypothetical protein
MYREAGTIGSSAGGAAIGMGACPAGPLGDGTWGELIRVSLGGGTP